MKVLFLSFIVGLGVGVLYGLIRVKSPAPPIVALLGLWGSCLASSSVLGFGRRNSTFRTPHPYALWVNATTVSFTILHHARRVTNQVPSLRNTSP
jgi:XapX domain-containing protein